MQLPSNSSVQITGESGAGKTETRWVWFTLTVWRMKRQWMEACKLLCLLCFFRPAWWRPSPRNPVFQPCCCCCCVSPLPLQPCVCTPAAAASSSWGALRSWVAAQAAAAVQQVAAGTAWSGACCSATHCWRLSAMPRPSAITTPRGLVSTWRLSSSIIGWPWGGSKRALSGLTHHSNTSITGWPWGGSKKKMS